MWFFVCTNTLKIRNCKLCLVQASEICLSFDSKLFKLSKVNFDFDCNGLPLCRGERD